MSTRSGPLLAPGQRSRPSSTPELALALAPGLGLALLLSACGGSAPAPEVSAQKACQQVRAVLANGPDPEASPGGQAEAQLLPLRQIRTEDQRLRTAVSQLDAAYQHLFASQGTSSAATTAVAAATRKITSICRGAAS
jgi:hypothetical protein